MGVYRQDGQFGDHAWLPKSGEFSRGTSPGGDKRTDGFIDRTGCVVIEPAFDANLLEWFSEGLFVIKAGEKYGYIDRTGRTIVAPRYWFAYEFQQGVASVQTGTMADGFLSTGPARR